MANLTPFLIPLAGRDQPNIDVPYIQGEIRRLKSKEDEVHHNFKDLRHIYTDMHTQ